MPHVVFVRAAFVFGLARGLVIEKDENDATAVGYAPFMQSIWTPEVLHGVLAERGPPGASLVGDAEDMDNLQINQNRYWVHDPSDTPTGPEHGWVYVDTTYAPHVQIFEQGEGHGIECSNSDTTVQVGTHHVDNRKIRSGSVLLIEGCAIMGEIDIRDRFVHVGQLLDQDASVTTFSAHPKSLAEIGDLVERHRVAFHVPVPGNEVVSTLEEAYAEFQSSGLRTQKNKIHRIKTEYYKPETGEFDLNQAKAEGDPWGISWKSGKQSITKSYKMEGELVKAEAKIEGSYEVSASLGTAVVGECVYKDKVLKGFLAYFTGNLDTSASATLKATIDGKFTVPLMPKGMSVNLPIFASAIQVYVKMGWDLDLVVEIKGRAEVTASAEGKGIIKMGAYYNMAVPNSAMPIHTGKFALEPKPMKAEAELAGKASLVLDVVFGAVATAWGVASAGISLSLTIEPGVFLDIKKCPAKPNFQQTLSLDVRCGAEFKTTWSALWGLRTGEATVYATGMKTCSVICDGPCVRTFVSIDCPPAGWIEMFVAAVQASIEAVKTLKKDFYELAIQAFCDEVEVEKLTYDGQRATVAGTSHPALSWDGKKFSSGGKEASKYQCTKDAIPKALSDIGNDDFVYYPMVNLVKTANSGLDVTDYYEE